MKKNINKFVNMIMEEVRIQDYTDEDFIDVFIMVFKTWVKENYGEEEVKYPFSYINKKHQAEFLKSLDIETPHSYYKNTNLMSSIGKKIVEKALHSYKEVPKSDESWFDKPINQKIWKSLEKELNLPSYMRIEVVEESPRNLAVGITVDFVDFIKSTEKNPYKTGYTLTDKMRKFLSKYGGIKFGNPLHGELRLNEKYYNYDGFDEWLKTGFNKEIKSAVKKELKDSSVYRGLKYQTKYGEPNITILWSSRLWGDKGNDTDKVRKIIRDMGYSYNLNISSY
jgi:hypothetical protein